MLQLAGWITGLLVS